MRAGYCSPSDLLIAGTRLPSPLTVEGAIASASDQMDSYIGARYVTPVLVDLLDPTKRQDSLVLQQICSNLTSGQIITSMAAGGSQNTTHAYGMYLLRFAFAQLANIQNGRTKLTTAELLPVEPEDLTVRGPRIIQGTRVSLMDAFYESFQPGGPAPGNYDPASDGSWPIPMPGVY